MFPFPFKLNHGDLNSFPFDFELNGIPFGSENRKNNSCHHDHIPLNLKGNGILVLSVYAFTFIECVQSDIYLRYEHQFNICNTFIKSFKSFNKVLFTFDKA